MRSFATWSTALIVMCAMLFENGAAKCNETNDKLLQSDSAPQAPLWERLDWTWPAAAAALTGGTVALFLSLDAKHQEDKFSDKLNEAKQTAISAQSLIKQKDKAKARARAANIMWGVTGGLLITTGIVFGLEYSKTKKHAITASPEIGPDRFGLFVSGRF